MFKKLRLRWKLHRWRRKNPHMHVKIETVKEFDDVSRILGYEWFGVVKAITTMSLKEKNHQYVSVGFKNVKSEGLYKHSYGSKQYKRMSYKKFKELFNL